MAGNSKDKKKTVTEIRKEIREVHGKESIIDLTKIEKMEVYKTNSLKINSLVGVGGFPKGKIIEVFGGESTGKTTFATQITAILQKNNGVVAYIDSEHAFDPTYAEALGVNLKKLLFAQPNSAEEALDLVIDFINSKGVNLIVVDSVAALAPQKELDGAMKEETMGLLARILGKNNRKIRGIANINKVTVVFINQERQSLAKFGGGTTTPGGRALKFFATIRIQMKNKGLIKSGDDNIGKKVEFNIIKNKVGTPHKKAILNLYFGEGFSHESEIIDYALMFGIINKHGSWFYNSETGEAIIQGYENLRMMLCDDETIKNDLEKQVTDFIETKRKEKAEDDEK